MCLDLELSLCIDITERIDMDTLAQEIVRAVRKISCPNANRDMNPYYSGCGTCEFRDTTCLTGYPRDWEIRAVQKVLDSHGLSTGGKE